MLQRCSYRTCRAYRPSTNSLRRSFAPSVWISVGGVWDGRPCSTESSGKDVSPTRADAKTAKKGKRAPLPRFWGVTDLRRFRRFLHPDVDARAATGSLAGAHAVSDGGLPHPAYLLTHDSEHDFLGGAADAFQVLSDETFRRSGVQQLQELDDMLRSLGSDTVRSTLTHDVHRSHNRVQQAGQGTDSEPTSHPTGLKPAVKVWVNGTSLLRMSFFGLHRMGMSASDKRVVVAYEPLMDTVSHVGLGNPSFNVFLGPIANPRQPHVPAILSMAEEAVIRCQVVTSTFEKRGNRLRNDVPASLGDPETTDAKTSPRDAYEPHSAKSWLEGAYPHIVERFLERQTIPSGLDVSNPDQAEPFAQGLSVEEARKVKQLAEWWARERLRHLIPVLLSVQLLERPAEQEAVVQEVNVALAITTQLHRAWRSILRAILGPDNGNDGAENPNQQAAPSMKKFLGNRSASASLETTDADIGPSFGLWGDLRAADPSRPLEQRLDEARQAAIAEGTQLRLRANLVHHVTTWELRLRRDVAEEVRKLLEKRKGSYASDATQSSSPSSAPSFSIPEEVSADKARGGEKGKPDKEELYPTIPSDGESDPGPSDAWLERQRRNLVGAVPVAPKALLSFAKLFGVEAPPPLLPDLEEGWQLTNVDELLPNSADASPRSLVRNAVDALDHQVRQQEQGSLQWQKTRFFRRLEAEPLRSWLTDPEAMVRQLRMVLLAQGASHEDALSYIQQLAEQDSVPVHSVLDELQARKELIDKEMGEDTPDMSHSFAPAAIKEAFPELVRELREREIWCARKAGSDHGAAADAGSSQEAPDESLYSFEELLDQDGRVGMTVAGTLAEAIGAMVPDTLADRKSPESLLLPATGRCSDPPPEWMVRFGTHTRDQVASELDSAMTSYPAENEVKERAIEGDQP